MIGKLGILSMSKSNHSSPFYDNIAIGTLVIENVVSTLGQISLAKAVLILPLLLHDPIIKRLSTAVKYRSIDEFLVKERINLGDINLRLENMLPLTINCISILKDLTRIRQDGQTIISVTKLEGTNKIDIGVRAAKIIKVIDKSSFLFNEDDSSTYLKFNIAL
ncbi:three component ABC system middle component [Pedobacter sp. WC2501]|uniref:three component ABC system middle component n=1 Tax=Pedobacter sp. WC2501 TaxID=3461400 RepID=UPI0040455623